MHKVKKRMDLQMHQVGAKVVQEKNKSKILK